MCLHRSTNRVYISRHVVFDESKFSFDNPSDAHVFKLQTEMNSDVKSDDSTGKHDISLDEKAGTSSTPLFFLFI